jgi:septal ring factor EnvC (AmiA/AmiB activator)
MSTMSISFDLNFWAVAASVISLGVSLITLSQGRQKATIKDIKDSEARYTRLSERITTCEAGLAGLNKDDIIAIHHRINEMLSQVNKIEGQSEEISKSLAEIRSYFMNKAAN